MEYKRRDVQKAIILALRNLGGSASRNDIKKEIADSEIDGLNYDKVYFRKKTNAKRPRCNVNRYWKIYRYK